MNSFERYVTLMEATLTVPPGKWIGKALPATIRDAFISKVPGFSGTSSGKWKNALELDGEPVKYFNDGRQVYLIGQDKLRAVAKDYALARKFSKTESSHGISSYEDEHGNQIIILTQGNPGEKIWVQFK